MTLRAVVFVPRDGFFPEEFKFVTLPRIGEAITLPDHGTFLVESVEHAARKPGKKNRPRVEVHLQLGTFYGNQSPPPRRRREYPPRWRQGWIGPREKWTLGK